MVNKEIKNGSSANPNGAVQNKNTIPKKSERCKNMNKYETDKAIAERNEEITKQFFNEIELDDEPEVDIDEEPEVDINNNFDYSDIQINSSLNGVNFHLKDFDRIVPNINLFCKHKGNILIFHIIETDAIPTFQLLKEAALKKGFIVTTTKQMVAELANHIIGNTKLKGDKCEPRRRTYKSTITGTSIC